MTPTPSTTAEGPLPRAGAAVTPDEGAAAQATAARATAPEGTMTGHRDAAGGSARRIVGAGRGGGRGSGSGGAMETGVAAVGGKVMEAETPEAETMEAGAMGAVVTGTASGIGRAVAERLLADGWTVTGVDLQPAGPAHPAYRHVAADLATPEGIAAGLRALDGLQVRALVHAAGIMRSDAAPETRAGLGVGLWHLHVAAPMALAEALLPAMPDGLGRIVVIGSRAARGRAGRGLYAASKAGAEGLVRSLALACLGRGITVNAVAPGAVATAQSRDPARADAPVALPPIGRMIAAEEIAASVGFLLSPEAGAITGQTLHHCGGASLVPPSPPAAAPRPQEGRDGTV